MTNFSKQFSALILSIAAAASANAGYIDLPGGTAEPQGKTLIRLNNLTADVTYNVYCNTLSILDDYSDKQYSIKLNSSNSQINFSVNDKPVASNSEVHFNAKDLNSIGGENVRNTKYIEVYNLSNEKRLRVDGCFAYDVKQ